MEYPPTGMPDPSTVSGNQIPGFYHGKEGLVCTSSEPTFPRGLTRELTSVLPVLELRWVHLSLVAWSRMETEVCDHRCHTSLLSSTEQGGEKAQLSASPRERNSRAYTLYTTFLKGVPRGLT